MMQKQPKEKIVPFIEEHTPTFPELERFRTHIESNKCALQHHPYSLHHGHIMLYKGIFLGISLLFAALTGYLYSMNFNWTFTFLLGTTGSIRTLLCVITLALSGVALLVGLWIQPEREIAHTMVKKAKQRSSKIYSRKSAELYGNSASKQAFAEHYEHWLEQIHDIEEETILIVKRIRMSHVMKEEEKERLYNQALYELHLELDRRLTAFNIGEALS